MCEQLGVHSFFLSRGKIKNTGEEAGDPPKAHLCLKNEKELPLSFLQIQEIFRYVASF